MEEIKYLVKISAEDNHNCYYRMTRKNDCFLIEMGRVGAEPVCMKRPMYLWETTYQKKLQQGYVDRSEFVSCIKQSKYCPIPEPEVRDLIDTLMGYANRALDESYSISWQDATIEMINEVQRLLTEIPQDDTRICNEKLLRIFEVIPRKMKDVDSMLVHCEEEIPLVFYREQGLLYILKSKIEQEKKESVIQGQNTVLDALGLQIRSCTESENKMIQRHLTSESAPYFARAFRVQNKKTDYRFYDYMKTHNLEEKDIHYLYHGSKNQNFFGIMTEGILLNPKAPITGKMFGHGIYFATRAKKSINYTDLNGSYWAKGNCSRAYLAVYKTVYRDPKNVYAWDRSMTNYRKQTIAPYDALFAHKGQSLLNDEIILYDEAQMTLQYLIELKEGK